MADRPDATSEVKSTSGADPPPVETGSFGKVTSFASSLNTVILSIFGTVVFAAIIYSVYLGVYDHKLIIRPIIVSKDLVEKGYTPEAVAYHLLSSLSTVTTESRSIFYKDEISEVVAPAKDTPEILVTDKGVSLEAIISGVKYILGYDNDWIISGDISTSAERQNLTLYVHHDGHIKIINDAFKSNIDLYGDFSTIAEKIITITDPYLMGVLYLQSKPRTALDIALQIIHNPRSSHQQIAHALLLKSAISRGAGNVDDAFKDALEAVSQSPSMPETHLGLGNAFLSKNSKSEAINEYRRTIEYDSRFAPGYYNLANLYQDEGNKEEAERNYRFAIICDPTMYKAYNNLGLILKDEGDLSGAIYQFLTAVSLEPNYESAHYNLGSAYFQVDHYADALHEFQTASVIEPDNNAPMIGIGKTLFSLGQKDEAKRVFNELIAKKRRQSFTLISAASWREAATIWTP